MADAYNTGNPYDLNTLMGGNRLSASEIGVNIYGDENSQHTEGKGNAIAMNPQFGGKRRSKRSSKGKRKTHRKKPVMGGSRKHRKKRSRTGKK
jgi:hypothetical protein